MQQVSVSTRPQGVRVFSAFLLSYLLIVMPFAQIAAGSRRAPNVTGRERESRRQADGSTADATANPAPAAADELFVNAPVPKPAPEPLAPVIVTTLTDNIPAATTVVPGGTINYTATVSNNGAASPADDATGVVFQDVIDAHTTLVSGSLVAAVSDSYTTIGNVQITIPDGATDLLGNDFDPDTGNNIGMTVTAETKSSTNCTGGCSNNVTINANGSFTYDPPVGFTGTDTFTYTAVSGTATATTTVKITVANKIWFINNNAGACTSNCDGRLSHPFTSLANFNTANTGAAGKPGDNDWIFVYESATDYTGPATLRLGQKFIGQDATASLISLTSFTQPSGTDPLPVMASGNGTIVRITTSVAATNGINLNSGNLLRGFTVGNTTGAKISGNTFGTLTVGNNASPDVTLNGSGQALSLTTGTLSVSGGFVSVTSTSSTGAGISLAGVADSDGVGGSSFSFGSTTISGATTQGILIGTTSADLNFGNTSSSGGSDGVSFQNNSTGTRTFGTLSATGGTGSAFNHAAGGGNVTVTGLATLASGAASTVDIQSIATGTTVNFSGGATLTKSAAGNTGVNINLPIGNVTFGGTLTIGTSGARFPTSAVTITGGTGTISLGTVSIFTNGFAGITATNADGTINTTAGTVDVNAAIALNITGPVGITTLGMTLTTVNSTGGTNNVNVTNANGTLTINGGALSGASGASFLVSGGTVGITDSGNITQANNAAMVSVSGGHNTGTITFQTGTLSATNGTGLQFDNADGTYNFNGTTTLNGGDAGIDILNGSAGTFSFGGTTITNPSGVALNVDNSTGGISISGTISKNTDGNVINFNGYDTGTATISGNLSCTSLCDGIDVVNNGAGSGTVTFSGATKTLNTAASVAVNLDNNDGGTVSFTNGGLDIDTTTGIGFNAINGGTVNVTTGANNNSINSISAAALVITDTTIGASGVTFRDISAGNADANPDPANGIVLLNTGSTGAFVVTGDATTTRNGSGGTIQNTTDDGARLTNTNNVTLEQINFTNNGQATGIIADNESTTGEHAVELNGGSNIILSAITVTTPGGSGVVALNLTGTSKINLGSLFTAINSTQSHAVFFNTTLTNTLFEINDTDFTNSTSSASTVYATNGAGGANVQFDIVNTCTFSGLSSQAVTITPGQVAGATGTFTSNVKNSTFSNATGLSENNIGILTANGALHVANVESNTFDNIAKDGTIANTSIIRTQNSGGRMTVTVKNNIIQNITYTAGGRHVVGHVFEPLTYSAANFTNITIDGNTATNVLYTAATNREFAFVDFRQFASGGNVTIKNNNWNMPSAGAQQALELRFRQENSSNVNVLVTNNGNGTGAIFNTTGRYLDIDAEESAHLQTTVTSNHFTDNEVANGTGIYTTTEDNAAAGSGATHCVNISGNTLTGVNSIALDEAAATTMTVTQASTAAMSAANGGATVTTPNGAPTFGQPACGLPTAMLVMPQAQPREYLAINETPGRSAETYVSASIAASAEVKPAAPSMWAPLASTMTQLSDQVSSAIEPTAHASDLRTEQTTQTVANRNSDSRAHHASSESRVRNATVAGDAATVSNHMARSMRTMAAPVSGETVTVNIGNLAAGQSVTIGYQVTVNNPPNLSLLSPPRVTTQGTVTGNGGINVSTDDPEPAGASDPTVTQIDLYGTTTTVITSGSPSNQGDAVTFTATVAPNNLPFAPPGGTIPQGTVQFLDGASPITCNEGATSIQTLNGSSQATCTTSALTSAGSPHTINANYAGNGNFDPSTGNVSQTINACVTNPIVTSTANTGAGTLRDAIANVCTAPNNVITFNIAGAGPHTITLASELAVAKNVVINNNSGKSITVSGNNVGRVFNINAGKTAAIIGLTISGGNAANGGGILNDGTLTVVNSTITGNTATSDGAGIQQTATATSLTLINTTISGNLANGFGGGVDVLGGAATIINSTITNNHGDNDNGGGGGAGGLRQQGAGTVLLKNTIVAGNFAGSGTTTRNDIEGAVDGTSTNNLIGDGTNMTGITNGSGGNQVGSSGSPINPQLGALASNGGTTQTHALLSTSTAIEAGSNANLPADTFDLDGDANVAETLPVDQRGTGFPRTADSADVDTVQTVDIGAFELHPSIEDIANTSTNEDTVKNVTFNLGDDTGTLITGAGGSVTATSSNTTLVPNNIANLSFTGSGGSRTLQITPAANQTGTTTITVTVTATNGRTATDTFDLTVGAVNDPPSGTDNTVTTNEDTAYTFTAADFGFTDPNDAPPNTLLAVKITTLPGLGTLTNNNVPVSAGDFIPVANINGGLLKFTPVADANGTPYTSFTFQVQDNGGGSDLDPTPNTMTINVTAVNDPPSFTIAGNPPAVAQDAGAQTVLNFATSISAGPGESQTLTFNITPNGSTGTLTFSTGPAINSTTGTLTYTANNGTNGTATFNVTLSDNGSNVPPNSNTSGTQSFTITVNPPNATPVVTTTGGNLAYTENAGAVAIDPGLTVTDSDSTDLVGATVAITAGFVSAQDTLAFTNQLGITGSYNSGTGVLTLTGTTTVANYQTALRTVTYANGSDNPTASRTITFSANDSFTTGTATRGIAITAVNDGPVNTVPAPQTTNEDTAKVFSSGNGNQISVADPDIGASPIKITLTGTNGTVTLSTIAGLSFTTGTGTNDATMVFTGTLAAVNTALNGMSFTPTADFNGAASLQIVSDDQGSTGTGGPLTDTDTVNITVTAQNDAPVVTTTAGNLSYTENDPATAIDPGLTVTDVDSPNLTGATVAITAGFVSAQDTLAFTNQLGITGNYNSGTGVLTLTGTTTVANYQTALRTVTYQNSSEDPTASRTVTFTADDGANPGSNTRGITISAVNDAPVNTVPVAQATNLNTPLTFSSGGGNQISIADVDAGSATVQLSLSVTNGTLTLNGTAGLNFACVGCSGDGTADPSMVFQGTIANINAALNGMTFTPTAGFSGLAALTITSNDLGNTGSGGAKSDTDTVNIQVTTQLRINDAAAPEPPSGTSNMVFTVSLSAPAPATVTVDFQTQDQPAGVGHAVAGSDYTTTTGSLTFLAGEQVKTINVPILSDLDNTEPDETFLVLLSNENGATVTDGSAVGTITAANTAGTLLISELRTSGPNGGADEFVEIYNNTDVPHVVPAGGYGLFRMGATCGDTPVLVGTIPATTIPARGHFLFTGSSYSLKDYGGTDNALGNAALTSDIPNDGNVGLFSTTNLVTIASTNRFDAVGFGLNTGGACDLLREGATLTPAAGAVTQHTYFRKMCDFVNGVGCSTPGTPKDTNNNATDFLFALTTPSVSQLLGAPGPENLASPIRRDNSGVNVFLLDGSVAQSADANRHRDFTAGANAAFGTLTIRRRVTNTTGAPVTRLRFRIVELTTNPSPPGIADLRALTGTVESVGPINDSVTCTSQALGTPCTVNVQFTTLETPPAQPNGGGMNSTLASGTITTGTPLANNGTILVSFKLGVQQTGNFRFLIIVEALP